MSEVRRAHATQIAAQYLEKGKAGAASLWWRPRRSTGAHRHSRGGVWLARTLRRLPSAWARTSPMLDINVDRLRYLDEVLHGRLTTVYSNETNIAKPSAPPMRSSARSWSRARALPASSPRDALAHALAQVIVDVAVDRAVVSRPPTRPPTAIPPILSMSPPLWGCNMPARCRARPATRFQRDAALHHKLAAAACAPFLTRTGAGEGAERLSRPGDPLCRRPDFTTCRWRRSKRSDNVFRCYIE